MVEINEQLLDEKLGQLEKVRPWSARLVSRLEGLLREGDDWQVFRLNPIAFAATHNISETEAIDLFLHASKLGLVEMSWNLHCPQCGDILKSFRSLKVVDNHFFCSLCMIDADVNLDDLIEIGFAVSPQVRRVVGHDPGALSARDFAFGYHFPRMAKLPAAMEAAYPEVAAIFRRIGGAQPGQPLVFADAIRGMTVGTEWIEAGETHAIEVALTPGMLKVFDFAHEHGVMAMIDEAAEGAEAAEVTATITADAVTLDVEKLTARPTTLRVTNNSTERCCVLTSLMPPLPRPEGPMLLDFDPFLSGRRLLTSQTFRDQYRSEVIAGSEGISVRDTTILFTDLKGSTALYDRIGDLKAYSLVRQHFDRLAKVIIGHDGAVVKTIGDAVMASFANPRSAVAAAIVMLEEIESFNREHAQREIILKIGIHQGASIAVTLNERLDYFGQTINMAARIQGLAGADEIYMSREIHDAPGVAETLKGYEPTPRQAKLKGIEGTVTVYRILPLPQADAGAAEVDHLEGAATATAPESEKASPAPSRRPVPAMAAAGVVGILVGSLVTFVGARATSGSPDVAAAESGVVLAGVAPAGGEAAVAAAHGVTGAKDPRSLGEVGAGEAGAAEDAKPAGEGAEDADAAEDGKGEAAEKAALTPAETKALRRKVQEARRKKHWPDVVTAAERLSGTGTIDWESQLALADAYAATGRVDEAVAAYDAFSNANATNRFAMDALFRAATALKKAERAAEGRPYLERVAAAGNAPLKKKAKAALKALPEP